MTEAATYFITGANRGIGLTLCAQLLLRPSTTVIATIRSEHTSATDLLALPTASDSKLFIIPLTFETLSTSPSTLLDTLASHSITSINTLILNAGTSSFSPILSTTLTNLQTHLETNTLSPILLFQTLHTLFTPLELSPSTTPKAILISSVLGSITAGTAEGYSLAYGMSKAAANYFIRKVHAEFPGISSLAVHPGWVRTENGEKYKESLGYTGEIPLRVEESAEGVIKQIDALTKSGTSGTFVGYDGAVVPW